MEGRLAPYRLIPPSLQLILRRGENLFSFVQEHVEPLKADTFVDSLDYLPNGHLAVVGFDKRLKIWDTATGELVNQSAEHTTYLATLSVSPVFKVDWLLLVLEQRHRDSFNAAPFATNPTLSKPRGGLSLTTSARL